MTIEPHELRVIEEKSDLDVRLAKLKAFLKTETCLNMPFDDRCLLVQQAMVMGQYAHILNARIERFTTKGA